jgi:hypothetical protein
MVTPFSRNSLCATSCIKRVTPTSRSRLINVCEEHTSTASSLRLDRPVRPTLVRKGHQDIIAYPSLFLSASSAVDLHRNCKATINDALRSRQRLLGGNLARCECTVNASLCQALRYLHITRNAACGVAFLTEQCFSAKTLTSIDALCAMTRYGTCRCMQILQPAQFSLPLTAPHTPCSTLSNTQRHHDHASGRPIIWAAATQCMSPQRNCDAA